MRPETQFPEHRFEAVVSDNLVPPSLLTGEAQLWSVRLNPGQTVIDQLASRLIPQELERASRYYFERDRHRFIVRWGFLRSLLGYYLAIKPQVLRFAQGPNGKPFLPDQPGLHFNISHSADLALVGISPDNSLGVDIEDARSIKDADAIASRFFAPGEVASYFGAPASQQRIVFFNCWTRKEAFVKATGQGILVPLDRFEVSVLPDEPVRVVSIEDDPEPARDWGLFHLEPAPGFIGALAMRPAPVRIRRWSVNLDRTALPTLP